MPVNISINTNTVAVEENINHISVNDPNNPNIVDITQPVTEIVEIITAGPQGPIGPSGSAGPPGSAVLSGGTNNFIPLWSGSTNLTSSIARQISGTLQISGSTSITGSLSVINGITGSLFGTSSWAISSSRAISSSNSLTASYVNPLNQNVIITGSLTVGSPAVSASNITFTNPGIGGDTRFTFSKTTDNAWLSVVERSTDRIYYEFGMSDNPDQTDYFQWKVDNYQAPALGWMPLQIGEFTNRFVASSNFMWGNFSIPVNTAFSTVNNSPTSSADYQVLKYAPTNSTTQTLYKDSGTGTGTVTLNAQSYAGASRQSYWIVIDAGGTTFTWGNGPTVSTPVATGVVITGTSQTLSSGVTITLSLTGHLVNDRWSFLCFARPTSAIGGSPVSSTMQTIYPVSNSIGQVIKGASGQTSNLQEWQNSSGTALAKVDALGSITAPSFTGSLFGTSSWAVSSSRAISSSYAINAATASNILGGKATHIPYFITDTTLATSSIYQSGSYSIIINQDNNTEANPEALYVWQPHPTSFNIISGKANLNNYAQLNVFNTNTGNNASSDIVATADNGSETTNFIDMGINGSGFTGDIGNANDAYLYSAGQHLHIGNTNPTKPIQFFAGGLNTDANRKLELNPDNNHNITGSLEISGGLKVNQGITGSLLGTSSFATTASFAISSSRAISSSFATTASYIQNVQSASYVLNAVSSSFSSTASFAPLYLPLTGGVVNGNITVNGTASIAFLNVQYESASVIYSSGSNVFGDATNDTQTLIGTVLVSGSQIITGSLNVSQGITGSLFGTASNSISASYSLSSSFSTTSLFAISSSNALTASYILPLNQNVLISGSLKLDPTQDPDPTGLDLDSTTLFQSSSNTALGYDLYVRQNGNLVKWKWIEGILETGLLYGGAVTYSGSNVYISPGSGIIAEHNATTSSEVSPMIEYVTWNAITQSVTNIATQQVTYLYIDNNGALQQQSTRFTSQQYHSYIPLGAVGHFDYTQVSAFGGSVQTAYDQGSQTSNFIDAFGPLKVSGYGLTGQANSLRLSVGSGTSFIHGGFYQNDPEFPSQITTPSQATASIAYVYRSGSGVRFDTNGGNLYTSLRPGFYDNGTGITSSLSNNNWTIQHIYSDPKTGVLYVYYGQTIYATYLAAVAAVATDAFTEGATFDFTTFIGFAILKSNTLDIVDTVDNKLVPAGLFRGSGQGSGGGTAVSNLEDLTDVSIISPTNGQALIYDAGIWQNGNPISASYALTASYAMNGGGGGNPFPYTGSAIITGSLIVTGSTTSTQGFIKPGAGSQYLLADGTTTAGTGGSAFPYTGSARITGSLVLVGPAEITGSFSQGEAGNESSGLYSHAEGSSTHARAPWSHAEGENNYALATGSHAEGSGTETSGYASHAEGSGTYASGGWGHSEGSNAGAEGDYSHAEGESTRAIGKFSHAEGSRVQSIGEASHAEGRYTTASGDYSHAEGYLTLASGSWSHAEGSETTASGLYSHAEGHQTLAFGQKSHAEGNQTRALALNSHAEGANTLANENNAHAEGMYTSASGVAAHSEGEGTKALGYASHAEGQNTTASGDYSHAEGYKNRAEGGSSHAEGSNTQALLYASHAEGSYTVASEEYAHAEGYGTIASGYASHAEGHYTTASGDYSHAEGSYTIAKGDYQHVQGQYNISSSAQSAFIVGNGTSDSNRSNLIFASGSQVQITGSAKITGSLDVTGSLSNGSGSIVPGVYSHAEGRTTSAGTTKAYLADSILAGVVTLSSSYSNATSSFSVGDYLILDDRQYSYYFGVLTSKITSVIYTAPNTVITLVDNSVNTEDPPAIIYNITKPDSDSVGNITYGGNYSHAEGIQTRASGDYSHAEGLASTAIGDHSHAEGTDTLSVGASSHAEGLGTIALGYYQHVQGQYNIASSVGGAFIHGNGTLDNNRSNLIYAAGNQVQITGSLNVSGSITGSLFGTSSYATNALTASYIIGGGGGSAFPYTGTAVITGSLVVTSTLQLDGSLIDYASVNSSIVGSNNLYTQATGSYTSAFTKYTVSNGTNARAGEFITVWNGTTVEFTDVSTKDIGNTAGVVFSSAIVSSQIQINATTATSGWKIKSTTTFI